MSNYRDDTQETAVAGSSTWLGLKSITESVARVTSTLTFGLMVAHSDQAKASDEVFGRAEHMVVETAVIEDQHSGQLFAGDDIDDQTGVSETLWENLRVCHEDSAQITDSYQDKVSAYTVETAKISDSVLGQRTSRSLVTEQAKADDFGGMFASESVTESVSVSDSYDDKLTASIVLEELARASDEVESSGQTHSKPAVELAQASSDVIDNLSARDLLSDTAVTESSIVGIQGDVGQAWTANSDTWAMSRYSPYTFSRIMVIDGVLYGEAEDGVYALSGGKEKIDSELVTGKIDLGKGKLVRPTDAYTEYQLSGTSELDVTTTQSGKPETYTYTLPQETADYLTNGRFILGRGLRGRHFSFAVRMSGEQGEINDFTVQVAETKRRV